MRISDWSSDVCSSDIDIALRTSYDQKLGSLACFHQAGKAESLKRITSLLDQVIEGEEAVLEKRSAAVSASQTRSDKLSRSAERRVGKECVSTIRSRESRTH